ncbi:MAG: DUF4426 domain-containing protein [Gammaproteobacteria bacterium]|nr:DUF4426 domain-containing protein [Gammaproteobacteria bacterium]NNJ91344.1 DUF4426 domain-containing protein [Gammaproteobacteria bacterium]
MKKLMILLVTVFLLMPALSQAENSTKIPGHTIHHNVITTDFLSPNIASAYRIIRSKNRGMINISVIQDVPGTTGTAVMANIRARVINLLGQQRSINLKEIREGNAIYYIGDFIISSQGPFVFMLDVMPVGAKKPFTAKLEHSFQ